MIEFTVYGTPVPQGSIRAFMPKGAKHPVLTGDNVKTKPWRQDVARIAQLAMQEKGARLFCRPSAVVVQCQFYFVKPKSASKSVAHKTTKPDLDKLARSLLDALTGICFEDDSQVTWLFVSKHFDSTPRAEITVTPP